MTTAISFLVGYAFGTIGSVTGYALSGGRIGGCIIGGIIGTALALVSMMVAP